MLFKKKMENIIWRKAAGFTLVELLVAVAVIAVGMVFVLGAFSRCLLSSETSKKMIKASFLLSNKMWEIDLEHALDNGSIQGNWDGFFETSGGNFFWTQVITDASAQALGEEALVIEKGFNAEVVTLGWLQGRHVRNLSIARYVKKSNETF